MSTAPSWIVNIKTGPLPSPPAGEEKAPLHRLATVRLQEKISRRAIAGRLGVTVSEVVRQERESSDISLSTLYQWQEALDVPVSELLVEVGESLSRPIQQRAQLVRLMKTAVSIFEQTNQTPVRRFAQVMIDQLIDLMPELAETSSWPTVGKRRSASELGQAADRRPSAELLRQLQDSS